MVKVDSLAVTGTRNREWRGAVIGENTRLRTDCMRGRLIEQSTRTYTSHCCRCDPIPCLPHPPSAHCASWSSRSHLPASASLSCATSKRHQKLYVICSSPGTRLSSFAKRLQAIRSPAQCKAAGTTRLGAAKTLVAAWGHPKVERVCH